MKFFILSDNTDSLVGMRLVGMDGVVVHEKTPFLDALHKAIHDTSIGIILITTKLVALAPEVISELKLSTPRKIILEIPDRHLSEDVGKHIDDYVSRAIGVKL
jgi:V/A-type H+/Na+-transporting ATPase subunit F